MKKFILVTLIALGFPLITIVGANAQSTTTGFISIPASAFSGENGSQSLNTTGTATVLTHLAFAPVSLPHRARVTSLQCGGTSFFRNSIVFTLRRNEPQQANVDVATVRTSLEGTNFEFVNTNSVANAVVNNARFNYYMVADITDPQETDDVPAFCQKGKCSIGFCRIGYTINSN